MRKFRQIVLVLGDTILGFSALVLTVRVGFWNDFTWGVLQQHLLPFSLLYCFWFLLFYIFGLYDLNFIKPTSEFFLRSGGCFLACLGLGAIFFYLVPLFGITPKTNLLINTLIFATLFIGWRRLFYSFSSSLLLKNVGFLGKSPLARNLIKAIESRPQLGYKFAGFLDYRTSLFSQIKKKKINVVIVSLNLAKNKKLTQELYSSLSLKINIIDLARAYEIILHKIPIDFINENWFLANLSEGEKGSYEKIKRITDIILASCLLLLTLPLWALIALAVKAEDKGASFYKQKRVGKDRKTFWLWKFRSMREDAEKGGPRWAQQNDQRITKVGKILRRTHLDELPQLLNVLKGDISLVGPRPERPEFVKQLEKEIPHYHLRHLIKSGLTGWAQTKEYQYARTLAESHEKFQYDLYYIKNRSFLLDLGIILKTLQLLFKKE